jgi:hypothetical protein
MLAYVLALVVGLGSFALYMAAFFFPEIHRKNDFIWSGVGLFYALVLWVCADRITGGVLLGQTASVGLLGWLGWQTFWLRRQSAPVEQQTPLPTSGDLKAAVSRFSNPDAIATVSEQVASQFGRLKNRALEVLPTTPKQSKPEAPAPKNPYVPLRREDFGPAVEETAEVLDVDFSEEGIGETPATIASQTVESLPKTPIPEKMGEDKGAALKQGGTTPSSGATGLFQGFGKKKESKPVYVRKQYRTEAEPPAEVKTPTQPIPPTTMTAELVSDAAPTVATPTPPSEVTPPVTAPEPEVAIAAESPLPEMTELFTEEPAIPAAGLGLLDDQPAVALEDTAEVDWVGELMEEPASPELADLLEDSFVEPEAPEAPDFTQDLFDEPQGDGAIGIPENLFAAQPETPAVELAALDAHPIEEPVAAEPETVSEITITEDWFGEEPVPTTTDLFSEEPTDVVVISTPPVDLFAEPTEVTEAEINLADDLFAEPPQTTTLESDPVDSLFVDLPDATAATINLQEGLPLEAPETSAAEIDLAHGLFTDNSDAAPEVSPVDDIRLEETTIDQAEGLFIGVPEVSVQTDPVADNQPKETEVFSDLDLVGDLFVEPINESTGDRSEAPAPSSHPAETSAPELTPAVAEAHPADHWIAEEPSQPMPQMTPEQPLRLEDAYPPSKEEIAASADLGNLFAEEPGPAPVTSESPAIAKPLEPQPEYIDLNNLDIDKLEGLFEDAVEGASLDIDELFHEPPADNRLNIDLTPLVEDDLKGIKAPEHHD